MRIMRTAGDKTWHQSVKDGQPIWYAVSVFDEDRPKLKDAGFRFHGKKDLVTGRWTGKKLFYSWDIATASTLLKHAYGDVKKELEEYKVGVESAIEDSYKGTTDVEYPAPEGLSYKPYQNVGIEFMLSRGNTLLGDDMGLGKTIQAIGLYNASPDIKTCLVVCPNSLKLNWKREFDCWNIKGTRSGIADSNVVPLPEDTFDIVIINFESLKKANKKLSTVLWDLVVIDEAHYFKNPKTIRYKALFGSREFNRVERSRLVCATGTPICNRPMDLYALLKELDPGRWTNDTYWTYRRDYCGGDDRGHGSDEKLNKLQTLLRSSVMIRRLKRDVEKDLPNKIRQVIELEYDQKDQKVRDALQHEQDADRVIKNNKELFEAQVEAELAKASDNADRYKNAILKIKEIARIAFQDMARARKEASIAKIPYAVKFTDMVSETADKIVIFAHHRETLDTMYNVYGKEAVIIHGGVSKEDRQKAVDRFQEDDSVKKIFVSIQAGGVGITLTAASTAIFVEGDWVPGNMCQAEDRLVRIGAVADHVSIYSLVLRGSLDVNMARRCIEKQEVIEQTLDRMDGDIPTYNVDDGCTKAMSRKKVVEQAEKLDRDIIPYIHQAMQYIAGLDRDHAKLANGVGFNAIDSRIGHSLASMSYLSPAQAVISQKIIKKYGKQLPADLYLAAIGEGEEY